MVITIVCLSVHYHTTSFLSDSFTDPITPDTLLINIKHLLLVIDTIWVLTLKFEILLHQGSYHVCWKQIPSILLHLYYNVMNINYNLFMNHDVPMKVYFMYKSSLPDTFYLAIFSFGPFVVFDEKIYGVIRIDGSHLAPKLKGF